MYQSTVVGICAQRFLDNDLSWEEIRTYCERHQTMLSNWVPETMADVEDRAHTHRLCIRMREWYTMNSTLGV